MPERVHVRFNKEFTPVNAGHIQNVENTTERSNNSKKRKRKDVDTKLTDNNGIAESINASDTLDQMPKGQIEQASNSIQPATPNQARGHGSQRRTSNNSETESALPKPWDKPFGLANKPAQSSLKAKADALWPLRKILPVWSLATEIRQGLRDKDVMLLVGETGSGKSTQVPQILASEPWCKPRHVALEDSKKTVSVGGCIAITEPRRVAAITLARRVAEEMGTPLGSSSPASKVGYSVRFDNSTGPCTKIKFLTEGMLLQELLRDPWLKSYSAVIVDEVHERGVNVDLVLGFMRNMVAGGFEGRGGVPLKVAVMSATAEMERLGSFFEEGYVASLREEEPEYLVASKADDESEWSGVSDSENDKIDIPADNNAEITRNRLSKQSKRTPSEVNGHRISTLNGDQPDESPETSGKQPKRLLPHVATCHIEGRQYPVTVHYTPEPVQDWVDAALRTIFQIHYREPMPGDILVFLTGQETVESLESLVKEYALGLSRDVPKMLVLPLFAALPQVAQQRVFQPAPPRTRKIILATNIAETSVTVSGVRFVIDCGKAKVKQFRTRIGLDSLLVKPISKSAAVQRKGRAGREAPGQCYRLYTEASYLELQQSNTPEILRCDLSHAILTMKARGVDDIVNFPFLDPPPREGLEKALLQLYQLGALTESGTISEIGQQMAKLPLTVSLGRVLIAAADSDFDCVSEVIDIISCLSVENIFLNLTSEEKKEEAESARRDLYRREGDHLTLLTTVRAYAAETSDRKAWASRHFISHRAMQSVMDVRKQLRAQFPTQLKPNSNPSSSSNHNPPITPSSTTTTTILKCFLRGFATNTARLMPDGSYKTVVGNQTVAIHPSSVLFGKRVEGIMYNEYVYTTRSYARGVSAVQMDWVGEGLGL